MTAYLAHVSAELSRAEQVRDVVQAHIPYYAGNPVHAFRAVQIAAKALGIANISTVTDEEIWRIVGWLDERAKQKQAQ